MLCLCNKHTERRYKSPRVYRCSQWAALCQGWICEEVFKGLPCLDLTKALVGNSFPWLCKVPPSVGCCLSQYLCRSFFFFFFFPALSAEESVYFIFYFSFCTMPRLHTSWHPQAYQGHELMRVSKCWCHWQGLKQSCKACRQAGCWPGRLSSSLVRYPR